MFQSKPSVSSLIVGYGIGSHAQSGGDVGAGQPALFAQLPQGVLLFHLSHLSPFGGISPGRIHALRDLFIPEIGELLFFPNFY